MIQHHRLTSLVAVLVSSGLALALLVSLNKPLQMAQANSGVLCVAPGGTGCAAPCNATCYASVQAAVDAAVIGDEIRVAAGKYTGVQARGGVTQSVYLSSSVTIRGGYTTTNWNTAQPLTRSVILDAQGRGRVVYVANMVTPTLEGLTLQNGNALGQGGDPVITSVDVGGGVYAYSTSPVITNCRIQSNTAGFGGGLAFYKSAPIVANSIVTGNLAIQNGSGITRGLGAGIFLYQSPGTVMGNVIANNVASGTQAYDGGGGLYLDASAAMIHNNTIQGNRSSSHGGGLFIYDSAVTVQQNAILDNDAAQHGGAVLLLLSPASFEANTILRNQAAQIGGGFAIFSSVNFTLTNNLVAQNRAYYPAGLLAGGGSLGSFSQGTLIHNTFADNFSASANPWMIHLGNGSGWSATLVFTNNIIGLPGGVYVDPVSAAMLDTTFWDKIPIGVELGGPGTIISSTNLYGDASYIAPMYHIGPHSPVIDQGANAGVTTDIDGEVRPNAPQPDIGADEFYCHVLSSVIITGPTTGISGTAATFMAAITPPTATQWITFSWQATGQSPISRTISALSDTAIFTWTVTGIQTITATVDNCGGSAIGTHAITIYRPPIYLPIVLRSA
jgi:hypothetical protein